jgi:hypothetical protein
MNIRFLTPTARPIALAAILTAPLVFGTSSVSASPQAPTAAAEKKEAVTLRKTPEEYLATAEEYKKKAAAYREEAAAHRKMLEQYKEFLPSPEGQIGEDSYVKKMRVHCEGYINKAEALATEAEKFADFHRERAAELRTPAVKLPVTRKDHLAKAEEYRKKAAGYRAEAAAHLKMLADYRGQAKTERADEDPEHKEMRIHCEGYINKAESLAAEAEHFAEFHGMRAAELQGK